MKTRRTRVAVVLTGLVAAVSMAAPAHASTSICNDKYTQPTCERLQNLICYLTERCL